jgi:hypothetical protein
MKPWQPAIIAMVPIPIRLGGKDKLGILFPVSVKGHLSK